MSERTPNTPRRAAPLTWLTAGVLAAWLGGCTLPPRADPSAAGGAACQAADINPTDNTRLAGIEQLLREGKPYAALAQLDAMATQGVRIPQVDLTRADALRRIDRLSQAETLYRGLLDGCLQGRAWRGLGLLQAQRGQNADSLVSLTRARDLQPTDAKVRNDLGYALFLAQRFDDARFEYLTVLELVPGEPRAARNLVLLTLSEGRREKARELASSLGLDAATFDRLVAQADAMPKSAPTPPLTEPPASAASQP